MTLSSMETAYYCRKRCSAIRSSLSQIISRLPCSVEFSNLLPNSSMNRLLSQNKAVVILCQNLQANASSLTNIKRYLQSRYRAQRFLLSHISHLNHFHLKLSTKGCCFYNHAKVFLEFNLALIADSLILLASTRFEIGFTLRCYAHVQLLKLLKHHFHNFSKRNLLQIVFQLTPELLQ